MFRTRRFEKKLGIVGGKSVDFPKVERQLNNHWRSSPDAVLRDAAPYVGGVKVVESSEECA